MRPGVAVALRLQPAQRRPRCTAPAGSLTRFVGHPAHGASQLQVDLHRFAFLLGADNGEQLFGDQTSR